MEEKRKQNLTKNSQEIFDVIIIGGGATGLGAALDASSRGLKTLVLEQADFGKGTSSKSTKLIHGGLRYLKQGHLSLIHSALQERRCLIDMAPHLVHPLSFLIPNYTFWQKPYYQIGLKLYDLLAGMHNIHKSYPLSKENVETTYPTLKKEKLRGGEVYFDAQFDDTRLLVTLVKTIEEMGGSLWNYMQVISLLKENGEIKGVVTKDVFSEKEYSFYGKIIINATGVFTDQLIALDEPGARPLIRASRGTHIVVSKKFLPEPNKAVIIPKTDDGRVVFFIPWLDHTLIGTTDIATKNLSLDPVPDAEEIAFLLDLCQKYLRPYPTEKDILSVFAGLRPLVSFAKGASSSKVARDHYIRTSPSGLLTIAGGKWTTFRKMGKDVIDQAMRQKPLTDKKSQTKSLKLFGFCPNPSSHLENRYGSKAKDIEALEQEDRSLKKRCHPELPYTFSEILYSARFEYAHTVEDIIARRTRMLFLHAKATEECLPTIVSFLAKEWKKDRSWGKKETEECLRLIKTYQYS